MIPAAEIDARLGAIEPRHFFELHTMLIPQSHQTRVRQAPMHGSPGRDVVRGVRVGLPEDPEMLNWESVYNTLHIARLSIFACQEPSEALQEQQWPASVHSSPGHVFLCRIITVLHGSLEVVTCKEKGIVRNLPAQLHPPDSDARALDLPRPELARCWRHPEAAARSVQDLQARPELARGGGPETA